MAPPRFPFQFNSQAANTAGIYALVASLWIFFSDRVLALFVTDLDKLVVMQTVKGWFFVAVTTALVYGLVHRHITRLLQTEASLQASEERYREVVEGTDDLITQVDANGCFTFVNRRAINYFGLSTDDCIGLSAFSFVHPEDRERTNAWFARCLTARTDSDSIENRQVARSGESRPMLWTVNFSYSPDGHLQAIRSIGRDISERKLAEQALHEHLRMKSEFISTAAHELRTPLAAIMGYTELLLDQGVMDGFDPRQKREFLVTIEERAEDLNRIVDELLDLSRIEAGQKIALDIRPCNLSDVIGGVVDDFRTRFPARTILLRIPPQCRHNCCADPVRMRQVIANFLDNAVKYSSLTGEIVAGCAAQSDVCRIYVSDQGIGMSPEQKSRIFDQFYRADTSDTAIGGLGLGLSLARQIIEGHGGWIEVESEVGRGSTLTAVLPQLQCGEG
ncbi:MAG: PAS domain-containing sensor histidine kinase [Desulfuromonadales bacterium]|nr:PAS domain-containing sensor histidine kinase [Desulfuromonadales bacterium]